MARKSEDKMKLNKDKLEKLEEQMQQMNDTLVQDGIPVKFCPGCGSEEIGVESEALSPHDFCRACGFNSIKKTIVETMHFPTKIKEINKK